MSQGIGIQVPGHARQEIVHRNWGDTDDIIDVIMGVVNNTALSEQVAAFAEQYKASSPGEQKRRLRSLWGWVRENIPYVPDPSGFQIIKHPARTWEDAQAGKGADCKSMTVFVRFCLYHIGVPHIIRFASYVKSGRIQHVYAVAIVGGDEVIVDTVHTEFDDEVPFTKIKDIKPDRMTKIVEIAGIGQTKVDLPERPFIPFSRLTEAEALAATKIREMEMTVEIARKMGNVEKADKASRILEELNQVYSRGIHVGGLSMAKMPALRQYWREMARKDHPCYLNHMPLTAGIGDFDPTDDQQAYCQQQARTMANAAAMQAGYMGWSGQGSVPTFTTRQGGGGIFLEQGGDLYPYGEKYEIELQNCLELAEMENVVNEKFTEAGANFLYDQLEFDPSLTTQIQFKRLRQQEWISGSAQVTGLSEEVVRQVCRNGTIEYVANEGFPEVADPADFQREFRPYITGGANIGLEPSTIALIIVAFMAVFRVAAAAIISITTDMKFQEAYETLQVPGLPSIRPVPEEDWRNLPPLQEINPGGGDGPNLNSLIQDPTNLLLIGAAAYLILSPNDK